MAAIEYPKEWPRRMFDGRVCVIFYDVRTDSYSVVDEETGKSMRSFLSHSDLGNLNTSPVPDVPRRMFHGRVCVVYYDLLSATYSVVDEETGKAMRRFLSLSELGQLDTSPVPEEINV